jgi:nicotinamide-nucleotide amidase
MSFPVSILATGSELLDGRVVDTNSNLVAQALSDLGLKLQRVLLVDDDRSELIAGLSELGAVSKLIITSGGLGPTTDDLTRDIVSEFFGVGLYEEPKARAHLEAFLKKRGRPLDASNSKQAYLPVGATMIPNELGTAPGFTMIRGDGLVVCSLSGVPREFKKMFTDSVLPIIIERAQDAQRLKKISFKTFGMPESYVGKVISACGLPSEVTVSYRAAMPEIHVGLKAIESFDLEPSAAKVRAALGAGLIYTEDAKQTFFEKLQELLLARRATIASAESCTGGLIAEYLTRTPGSSEVFLGSVVSYDNDVKENVLHVPRETIAQHGAVSAEVVRIMAREVRALMKTTYGVAVSGVAGPAGGTEEKPVGTFFVGIAGPERSFELRCFYGSERSIIRTYAGYVALDLVRRELQGQPIPAAYPITA